MEILSASSDTTHYKLLGVEETDDATKIRSAYRKLAIDVHPDHNTFPKASEAFKRIVLAASVLSNEQSRAKFDHALAADRKTAHGAARNAAAREPAARNAAVQKLPHAKLPLENLPLENLPHAKLPLENLPLAKLLRVKLLHAKLRVRLTLSPVKVSPLTLPPQTHPTLTLHPPTIHPPTIHPLMLPSLTMLVQGPNMLVSSDAQSTSTLHPPKKRRE
nr:chaperone protein DnaJ 49-like [Tanacetum cinerariifolium]